MKSKTVRSAFWPRMIALGMVALTAPSFSLAKEGSATSGGGGTHTCLNADGSVRSSEMYDLYEGREARGYRIVEPGDQTAISLLASALEKIWRADAQFAMRVLGKMIYFARHKLPKWHKQFAIVKDANLVFVDKGCQYQQIAQWNDDYRSVFVDADLEKDFGKSELNRAALMLHEAVYAVLRSEGAKDSDEARKLVAQAFSDAPMERASKLETIEMKNYGKYTFVAKPSGPYGWFEPRCSYTLPWASYDPFEDRAITSFHAFSSSFNPGIEIGENGMHFPQPLEVDVNCPHDLIFEIRDQGTLIWSAEAHPTQLLPDELMGPRLFRLKIQIIPEFSSYFGSFGASLRLDR